MEGLVVNYEIPVSGFSTVTKACYYQKIGKLVSIYFYFSGTSNTTALTATLPFTSEFAMTIVNGRVADSIDSNLCGRVQLTAGSATATFTRDADATAWTNFANKVWAGHIFYFTSEL